MITKIMPVYKTPQSPLYAKKDEQNKKMNNGENKNKGKNSIIQKQSYNTPGLGENIDICI